MARFGWAYVSSLSTGSTATAGGSDKAIQFNSGSSFSGSSNFTFDYTTNTVRLTGTLYADTLIVSSSTIYKSGSTKFGDDSTDTHQFTGSLLLSSSYISQADYIDFNVSASTPSHRNGRVYWNNTDGCLDIYNAEADVTLQVGQENWTRVFNNTGAIISNGTVVRLNGSQGDYPTIEKAQSIAVSGSVNLANQILGIATHTIEINTFGYITTQGLVKGLNTSAFNDGDTLFVSTSAGLLTKVAPTAPYEIIPVGVCVKASPGTSGIIYVTVQQPLDFSDLSSVYVSGNYSYGDILTYVSSSTTGYWRHTNQLSGSYGVTGSLALKSGSLSVNGDISGSNQLTIGGQATFNSDISAGSIIGNGAIKGGYNTFTGSFPVAKNSYFIGINSTSGVVTASLTSATQYQSGQMLIFKDIGGVAGTNNILIKPSGSQTIDGATGGALIATNSGSLTLVSNGSNQFYIVASR